MKTLTKLDGSVVELQRGRPNKMWAKQSDGNYKEMTAEEYAQSVADKSKATPEPEVTATT